jgi:hypothetical protein
MTATYMLKAVGWQIFYSPQYRACSSRTLIVSWSYSGHLATFSNFFLSPLRVRIGGGTPKNRDKMRRSEMSRNRSARCSGHLATFLTFFPSSLRIRIGGSTPKTAINCAEVKCPEIAQRVVQVTLRLSSISFLPLRVRIGGSTPKTAIKWAGVKRPEIARRVVQVILRLS